MKGLPSCFYAQYYSGKRCLVCGRRVGVNNWMRHFRAHLRK